MKNSAIESTSTLASARNSYGAWNGPGAFGDLGTLIPFIVGYISVLKMDPMGIPTAGIAMWNVALAFGVRLVLWHFAKRMWAASSGHCL